MIRSPAGASFDEAYVNVRCGQWSRNSRIDLKSSLLNDSLRANDASFPTPSVENSFLAFEASPSAQIDKACPKAVPSGNRREDLMPLATIW